MPKAPGPGSSTRFPTKHTNLKGDSKSDDLKQLRSSAGKNTYEGFTIYEVLPSSLPGAFKTLEAVCTNAPTASSLDIAP